MVVQDWIIYEDVYIFVFNLYDMGLMIICDFENYSLLFKMMIFQIQLLDLLIYL